ncbi:MAG TPA: hypothetical protein VJR89_29310 [Polyangiales bacterium]|nr:hypothetical protein [Polyangiales bacterium]
MKLGRAIALCGCALWSAAWSAAAHAQTRVVVNEFGGASASQVRDAVVEILEEHAVEVVSPKVANAQARRSGAELDTEAGRVRVSKKLRLTAFLDGRIEKGKRNAMRVRLTVYGARDGMVAGEMNLSAPKKQLVSELQATMWEQLGAALQGKVSASAADDGESMVMDDTPQRAAPQRQAPQQQPRTRQPIAQAEAEPEQPTREAEEAELDEPPAAEQPEESTPSALAALDMRVGARFGTRKFEYNDPLPGLRKYGMSMSPNLSLRVRWYPAAHFDDGVMSNFGLDLRGELLVGVSSENRAGQKFSTSSHNLGIGVRGRLPIARHELGAVLGYGVHTFSLEGTSKADPDVPNASYGFLRTGLDARFRVYDPVYVQLEAAYLFGLSHGEIEDRAWFPHTSGDGIEGELAVGWTMSKALGFEASFGITRYFMSFDPEPRDASVRDEGRVAGGAIDQYLSTRIAMVIQL